MINYIGGDNLVFDFVYHNEFVVISPKLVALEKVEAMGYKSTKYRLRQGKEKGWREE